MKGFVFHLTFAPFSFFHLAPF